MTSPAPSPPHEAGLRVIIAYKTVKCAAWLVLAAALVVGLRFHLTDTLRDFIIRVDTHLSNVWAIRAARWLLGAVTTRHILYTIAALLLDGTVTGVEGWALHHRKPWGEWLVVFTTSSLLPFEIWAIISHARLHRLAILAINVVIVVYLVQRIRERRHARHAATP